MGDERGVTKVLTIVLLTPIVACYPCDSPRADQQHNRKYFDDSHPARATFRYIPVTSGIARFPTLGGCKHTPKPTIATVDLQERALDLTEGPNSG